MNLFCFPLTYSYLCRKKMVLYPQLIMEALATVTYAGTKKNLVESGMVADTPSLAAPQGDGEKWKVKVVLEFPRDTRS